MITPNAPTNTTNTPPWERWFHRETPAVPCGSLPAGDLYPNTTRRSVARGAIPNAKNRAASDAPTNTTNIPPWERWFHRESPAFPCGSLPAGDLYSNTIRRSVARGAIPNAHNRAASDAPTKNRKQVHPCI